jgi:hypothetical protein
MISVHVEATLNLRGAVGDNLKLTAEEREERDQAGITPERAAELIHKHVLVRLTWLDSNGGVRKQEQLHGNVISASASGILLQLPDGLEYNLPPDYRAFEKANAGDYRLRSTGEVVINPDYVATWIVNDPHPTCQD